MAKHNEPTGKEHDTCECIHVHHHFHLPESLAVLPAIFQLLTDLKKGQGLIMADLNAIMQQINDATNQMSSVQKAEAATLQTISDEMDVLIAKGNGGTITTDDLARLQTLADAVSAAAATQTSLATTSAGIASKGATNPVPVPVPAPTPDIPPATTN